MPAIRQSMERTVPEGFITDVSTVDQQVDESLVGDRLLSILASLFAGLALILSAIGLYGIMSYTVIRRTRELGIRIAVGAQRGAVLWLVLRATLILAATGLGLGLPLVWFSSRYIETQLYGVKAGDPASLAAAMLTLLSVALASAFWPAWRASRVDPMISLRQE
jgi:ABC-type antimicrobial peptide transport system permease subunit